METFDDFRRRKFGGDLAASSSTFHFEQPERAAAILRQRLHSLYDAPVEDLPDAFRVLLTKVSSKLDRG